MLAGTHAVSYIGYGEEYWGDLALIFYLIVFERHRVNFSPCKNIRPTGQQILSGYYRYTQRRQTTFKHDILKRLCSVEYTGRIKYYDIIVITRIT